MALYFSTIWSAVWKKNLINERKKALTVTQLLVSNQKFTGENHVTRRCCRRPRHFCAGVGTPVYGQLLFCDVENHLITTVISVMNFKVVFYQRWCSIKGWRSIFETPVVAFYIFFLYFLK